MSQTDKSIQNEANYILDCDDWREHADIGLGLSEYPTVQAQYPALCKQIQNTGGDHKTRAPLGYQLAELVTQ